jgi:transcriptional regulator with XRE-family HTH domain
MSFDRQGFDKEVGLLLQLARKRRDITQAELAKKMGLERATYANIESGRARVPVDVLWRAAVVLSVSIATLVPEALTRQSSKAPIFRIPDALLGYTPRVPELPVNTTVIYGTNTSSGALHGRFDQTEEHRAFRWAPEVD